jgi:hypothetical protein
MCNLEKNANGQKKIVHGQDVVLTDKKLSVDNGFSQTNVRCPQKLLDPSSLINIIVFVIINKY